MCPWSLLSPKKFISVVTFQLYYYNSQICRSCCVYYIVTNLVDFVCLFRWRCCAYESAVWEPNFSFGKRECRGASWETARKRTYDARFRHFESAIKSATTPVGQTAGNVESMTCLLFYFMSSFPKMFVVCCRYVCMVVVDWELTSVHLKENLVK